MSIPDATTATKLEEARSTNRQRRHYSCHTNNRPGRVRRCTPVGYRTYRTYARLCAVDSSRFALSVEKGRAFVMSGVMIYPIPSMSQCECDCPWDASQCVSHALLPPTRYKELTRFENMFKRPTHGPTRVIQYQYCTVSHTCTYLTRAGHIGRVGRSRRRHLVSDAFTWRWCSALPPSLWYAKWA